MTVTELMYGLKKIDVSNTAKGKESELLESNE